MPRGAPDYNNPDYNIAAVSIDNAGTVMAIKGILPLDGLGRIVLFDTFSDGYASWSLTQSQSLGLPDLVANVARVSPFSVRLNGSAGVNASLCSIRRSTDGIHSYRTGIEFSLLSNLADVDLNIFMQQFNGFARYSAEMRVRPDLLTVELRTPTGYDGVANLPNSITTSPWVTIKLVADFETGKYIRLLIGDSVIPLSLNIYQVGAATSIRGMLFEFQNSDTGKTQDEIYIGHVILTMDEP